MARRRGGACISLLGSAMHFVFRWSGCSALAAVFCAVNESIYEHIKIMLFPILFWWLCAAAAMPRQFGTQALNAATVAMYLSLCLLLAGNGLSQAGGFETLAYDISLFVACIFFGQTMGYYYFYKLNMARDSSSGGCCHLLLAAMVVMLFVCTFSPPQWAYMFEDHHNASHTFYGLPEGCQ